MPTLAQSSSVLKNSADLPRPLPLYGIPNNGTGRGKAPQDTLGLQPRITPIFGVETHEHF
jgi:hypothetical protein